MQGDNLALNPPIQYAIIWLIIGCCLLASILVWYGVLVWISRKKKVKTISQLRPGPEVLNLEQLKQRYLELIEECYQSYLKGRTNLRGLHRGLSMTTRYFVYQVRHFPAPHLTLNDLKKAPYPKLSRVIEDYYEKEFAAIEYGDAHQSVEAAKEFIRQWV